MTYSYSFNMYFKLEKWGDGRFIYIEAIPDLQKPNVYSHNKGCPHFSTNIQQKVNMVDTDFLIITSDFNHVNCIFNNGLGKKED